MSERESLHEHATGRCHWAIAEGYLAPQPSGVIDDEDERLDEHLSKHETLFFLNAGETPADVSLSIYLADRDPIGPYHFRVEPRRTCQVCLEDLAGPPVPRGKDFASLVQSNAPIVVLATRRRTSNPDDPPLTKIAFSA